jgi:hypothetical protein
MEATSTSPVQSVASFQGNGTAWPETLRRPESRTFRKWCLNGGERGTVFRGPFQAVHLRNDCRAGEFHGRLQCFSAGSPAK